MSRDPWKLEVFCLADDLVVRIYNATQNFPEEERFGLRAQLRRAALSVPANLVEGCARDSSKDYVHFVNIAFSSACETRYLLHVAHRLAFIGNDEYADLARAYDRVCKALNRLQTSLKAMLRERRTTRRQKRTQLSSKAGQGVALKAVEQKT
ncbi:MAG TPA: four helix bundle protein [Vicinamibacterales bacterium]